MGQQAMLAGMGASALGGVMGAGGAYLGGLAEQGYYNAAAQSTLARARLGEMQAQRQIDYDNEAAVQQMQDISREGRRVFGAQKAAMAAGGMDLSSGSAQEVFLDSLRAEQEDLSAVSFQAQRSAYEKQLQARLNSIDAQSQAAQAVIAGKSARRAGMLNAAGTLLSAAGTVAGQWYGYKELYGQNKNAFSDAFSDYFSATGKRVNKLSLF